MSSSTHGDSFLHLPNENEKNKIKNMFLKVLKSRLKSFSLSHDIDMILVTPIPLKLDGVLPAESAEIPLFISGC